MLVGTNKKTLLACSSLSPIARLKFTNKTSLQTMFEKFKNKNSTKENKKTLEVRENLTPTKSLPSMLVGFNKKKNIVGMVKIVASFINRYLNPFHKGLNIYNATCIHALVYLSGVTE